jgi:hypothetical protein
MDWEILKNPYVIGGGLIVGVLIFMSRGASGGASSGDGWTDLSAFSLRSSELALEASKADSARQLEVMKMQAGAEQVRLESDDRRYAISSEIFARSFQAQTGAAAAVRLAGVEAQSRAELARIAGETQVTSLQIQADAAKYTAKKQSEAAKWGGALQLVGQLVGSGEKAASFALGLPPVK